jgi:TPR repeat protein
MNSEDEIVERALEHIAGKSYARAVELLLPLVEHGNPRAQCNMALLYSFGFGVSQDTARAVELYRLVGEQNIREGHLSALAYHNLATLFVTGAPGLPPDPARAREFARKSEELGFPMPQTGDEAP